MANKKARKSCPANAATEESKPSPAEKGSRLNAQNVIIIAALISLVGSLATSVIGNWDKDKLRGNQSTQAAASDTKETLLAYNEQRRTLVEGAYDQALTNVQEAESQTTGQDAVAFQNFAAYLKEGKTAIQRQYDKVLGAIKDEKPVQAEINKTELNTMIRDTQREYDNQRIRKMTFPMGKRPKPDGIQPPVLAQSVCKVCGKGQIGRGVRY